MNRAVVADNKPVKVSLEKDKQYLYCTCGRSQNQPFCDGAHAGTDFIPEKFIAQADGNAYLCACKATSNATYCDGSHKQFSDQQLSESAED